MASQTDAVTAPADTSSVSASPADTVAAERARYAERRFAFAEGYGGAGVFSSAESASIPGVETPGTTGGVQLAFGALHFWSHADFYVRFTTLNRTAEVQGQTLINVPTVETGARVYPLPVRPKSVRPYVGASWTVETLKLGEGPYATINRIPVEAGLTARWGRLALDGSVRYGFDRQVSVPLSREDPALVDIEMPSWSVTLGARAFFESTGLNRWGVASGGEERREQRLREAGRLSGVTLSIGPSSSTPLRGSSRNESSLFQRKPSAAVFPDVSVGYYVDGLDAFANVAYRNVVFGQDAFGTSQRLGRRSVTVEVAKVLGDYHGFVPFLGGGVTIDRLTARETDQGTETFLEEATVVAPSLLFGWDIRPTRTQPFILRTNLRYAPGLELGDGTIRFDQLEFNFIQFVWHFGR
ncbi:MAG: hypothetical protein AAGK21_17485 [Bacteroidota bacterium]